MPRPIAAFFIAIVAAIASTNVAAAAQPEIYTGRFSNLALGGYDPVAYFTVGAPTKGDADISFEYKGAIWRFASTENLALFQADPEAYAPQYGGYCAWALANGDLAPGRAKFWRIRDGKLYLNFNGSVQRRWLDDPAGFIAAADENWPSVLE